ncbi:MAG: hypothetical protein COX78_01640 [Candidatus Levybacteria bacterium CG_4_10_14_0_2_um_filter_35_8]|nr:MAG: hypothetical protein COX78_01640 [Candidatus Levybacteria bacterium CG_4_10_14_0_2_um_filter_35_8]
MLDGAAIVAVVSLRERSIVGLKRVKKLARETSISTSPKTVCHNLFRSCSIKRYLLPAWADKKIIYGFKLNNVDNFLSRGQKWIKQYLLKK